MIEIRFPGVQAKGLEHAAKGAKKRLIMNG